MHRHLDDLLPPDALRWNRAALITANRWIPPEKSTNSAPDSVGGPFGSPVVEALPYIACTVTSWRTGARRSRWTVAALDAVNTMRAIAKVTQTGTYRPPPV